MSALSIGISITAAAAKKFNVIAATGPIQTSPPSVDPDVGQVGVAANRTAGIYQPRGGGTVTLDISEWRIGATPVGTGPDYTPTKTDVGEVLYYVEQATETGGNADGTHPAVSVILGIVTPVAPAITAFNATHVTRDASLDIVIDFGDIENLPITCYFVGLPNGDAIPSDSQIIAGHTSNDTPADIVTSFVASVNGSQSTSFSDVASGAYDLHAAVVDAAGNVSNIASVLGIALSYLAPLNA